jgi:hypothetical protein
LERGNWGLPGLSSRDGDSGEDWRTGQKGVAGDGDDFIDGAGGDEDEVVVEEEEAEGRWDDEVDLVT